VLTGDFNPVHWVPPYAKMAGFKSTILHGFSTLARSIETLNNHVWSGDRRRLKTVDVRFVKPLLLPNRVHVFHGPGRFSVGDAPGGPAYLTGEYTSENPNHE
jgi:acyl dehydratase